MSNEVNLQTTFLGTLDPGWSIELYDWSGDYDKTRVKGRFFTVAPLPDPPFGTGVRPQHIDMEIIRVWETVWEGTDGRYVFQRNLTVMNVGPMTGGYAVIRAETDNDYPV
jgi:hypothetical protein